MILERWGIFAAVSPVLLFTCQGDFVLKILRQNFVYCSLSKFTQKGGNQPDSIAFFQLTLAKKQVNSKGSLFLSEINNCEI